MRITENGGFSVTIAGKEKKKTNGKKENKAFSKSKPTVSYNASKDLARIASAKTSSQITLILFELRGRRKSIEKSGADSEQIKSVCRRIDKVMRKGGIKIKNLKKEEQIKERAKQQRKKGEWKRAERTEKELRERKKKRKAREHGEAVDSGGFSPGSGNRINDAGIYEHYDAYAGLELTDGAADMSTAGADGSGTAVNVCI